MDVNETMRMCLVEELVLVFLIRLSIAKLVQ